MNDPNWNGTYEGAPKPGQTKTSTSTLPPTPQQPVRECWVEVPVSNGSPAVGDFVIVKLDNDEDKWLKAKRCHDGWMIFWMDGYKQLGDNNEVTHYLKRVSIPVSLIMQQAKEIVGKAWDAGYSYAVQEVLITLRVTDRDSFKTLAPDRDTYLNSFNLPA